MLFNCLEISALIIRESYYLKSPLSIFLLSLPSWRQEMACGTSILAINTDLVRIFVMVCDGKIPPDRVPSYDISNRKGASGSPWGSSWLHYFVMRRPSTGIPELGKSKIVKMKNQRRAALEKFWISSCEKNNQLANTKIHVISEYLKDVVGWPELAAKFSSSNSLTPPHPQQDKREKIGVGKTGRSLTHYCFGQNRLNLGNLIH